MESLILLTKYFPNCVHNADIYLDVTKIINILPQVFDATKCKNSLCTTDILSNCDFSRVSNSEYLSLFTNLSSANRDCIMKLFTSLLDASAYEKFQSIEFEKFDENVQQQMLNEMLVRDISVDIISLLADKMKSVNYGGSFENSTTYENSPLLYCAYSNKLEYVKLLVEKYDADIEYTSKKEDMNAIMVAADYNIYKKNNIDIVRYLYDKGSRLETSTRNIEEFGTIYWNIWMWDKEKLNDSEKKYIQLKSEYDINKKKLDALLAIISSLDLRT